MKVDPNRPLRLDQECVLCEDGDVVLFDDSRSAEAEIGQPESAFQKFLETLDPNRCYIAAFIPDDADREVFFKARDAVRRRGFHMQATVETAPRQRTLWENYKTMKTAANAVEDQAEG